MSVLCLFRSSLKRNLEPRILAPIFGHSFTTLKLSFSFFYLESLRLLINCGGVFGTKYSRMNQVKFVKVEGVWSVSRPSPTNVTRSILEYFVPFEPCETYMVELSAKKSEQL